MPVPVKIRARRYLNSLTCYRSWENDEEKDITNHLSLAEGEVSLGIYAFHPKEIKDSIVVTTLGLWVFNCNNFNAKFIKYTDIVATSKPSKSHKNSTLEIKLKNGSQLTLKVMGLTGEVTDAFSFLQFLMCVDKDIERETGKCPQVEWFTLPDSDQSSFSEAVSWFIKKQYTKYSKMSIPREKIKKWMQSDDLETLGIVFTLMKDYKIEPPLSLEDEYKFMILYFECCLLKNPENKTEWSDSRETITELIVDWFKILSDKPNTYKMLDELSEWLAQLYQGADNQLRTYIVRKILYPLLEKQEIAKFLTDWEKEPILEIAYSKARKLGLL